MAATRQDLALAIVPKVGSTISMPSSVFIITEAISDHRKGKGTAIQRALVGMSVIDVCASFAWWLNTWAVPPTEKGHPLASGSVASCNFQGFLLQLAIGAPLYNCSLALYYVLVIRYNWTNEQLVKIERFVHAFILTFTIGTSIAGLPMTMYNPIGNVCWVIGSPQECGNSSAGPANEDVSCDRGDYAWLFGIVLFYGPLWTCVFFTVVAMLLIYIQVRRTFGRSQTYRYHSHRRNLALSRSRRGLFGNAAGDSHGHHHHHHHHQNHHDDNNQGSGSSPALQNYDGDSASTLGTRYLPAPRRYANTNYSSSSLFENGGAGDSTVEITLSQGNRATTANPFSGISTTSNAASTTNAATAATTTTATTATTATAIAPGNDDNTTTGTTTDPSFQLSNSVRHGRVSMTGRVSSMFLIHDEKENDNTNDAPSSAPTNTNANVPTIVTNDNNTNKDDDKKNNKSNNKNNKTNDNDDLARFERLSVFRMSSNAFVPPTLEETGEESDTTTGKNAHANVGMTTAAASQGNATTGGVATLPPLPLSDTSLSSSSYRPRDDDDEEEEENENDDEIDSLKEDMDSDIDDDDDVNHNIPSPLHTQQRQQGQRQQDEEEDHDMGYENQNIYDQNRNTKNKKNNHFYISTDSTDFSSHHHTTNDDSERSASHRSGYYSNNYYYDNSTANNDNTTTYLSDRSDVTSARSPWLVSNLHRARPVLSLSSSAREDGLGTNTTTAAAAASSSSGTAADKRTLQQRQRQEQQEQIHRRREQRRRERDERRKQNKQNLFAVQAILYSGSFFITWMPSTVWSIGRWFNIDSYTLDILAALCEPLQGFWNMLIFIRRRPTSQAKLYTIFRAPFCGLFDVCCPGATPTPTSSSSTTGTSKSPGCCYCCCCSCLIPDSSYYSPSGSNYPDLNSSSSPRSSTHPAGSGEGAGGREVATASALEAALRRASQEALAYQSTREQTTAPIMFDDDQRGTIIIEGDEGEEEDDTDNGNGQENNDENDNTSATSITNIDNDDGDKIGIIGNVPSEGGDGLGTAIASTSPSSTPTSSSHHRRPRQRRRKSDARRNHQQQQRHRRRSSDSIASATPAYDDNDNVNVDDDANNNNNNSKEDSTESTAQATDWWSSSDGETTIAHSAQFTLPSSAGSITNANTATTTATATAATSTATTTAAMASPANATKKKYHTVEFQLPPNGANGKKMDVKHTAGSQI